MTLVARGKYLISRERNAPPPGAALPKALYRPLAIGAVLNAGGNQVCNYLAVPGNGDSLAMLDRSKEFGQARLGLGSPNLTHV